jgi:hypothetical protein
MPFGAAKTRGRYASSAVLSHGNAPAYGYDVVDHAPFWHRIDELERGIAEIVDQASEKQVAADGGTPRKPT